MKFLGFAWVEPIDIDGAPVKQVLACSTADGTVLKGPSAVRGRIMDPVVI
jgi:hypothetical protein